MLKRREKKRLFRDFMLMIVSISFCSIIAMIFKFFLGARDMIGMAYIIAIVIVSQYTRGYIWGAFTAILGVVAANFFVAAPYFKINFIKNGYIVTFMIMLLIFVFISFVISFSKQRHISDKEREKRSESINKLSGDFMKCNNVEEVLETVMEFLREQLEFRVFVFMKRDDTDRMLQVGGTADEEAEIEYDLIKEAYSLGKSTENQDMLYVPIMISNEFYGTIAAERYDGRMKETVRLFLELIARQTALSIKLINIREEQRLAVMQTEKERMRNTLLRTISHDLRTPLTSILGGSTAILENGVAMSEAEKRKLLMDINDEARWLTQMVENLLAVTKIDENTEMVSTGEEILEEIIEEAVSRLKNRFPEGKIHVQIPDEVIIAHVDQTLIKQVIINAVENAFKHAGQDSEISIKLSKEREFAKISIIDNGPGIPEEMIPVLFDEKSNKNITSDSSRGYGLGLPICKSIIKAHGGTLYGENIAGKGFLLYFTIPMGNLN